MTRLGLTGGRLALLLLLALAAAIGGGGVVAQDEATPTDDDEVEADGTPAPAIEIELDADVIVVERALSDTLIDLGEPGETIGDMNVFANPIYDETNTTQIGSNQGFCILTNPGVAFECSWTLFLEDGQLTVQGPVNADGSNSFLTITGGTGAYAGVSGQMLFETLDPEENTQLFTYEFA